MDNEIVREKHKSRGAHKTSSLTWNSKRSDIWVFSSCKKFNNTSKPKPRFRTKWENWKKKRKKKKRVKSHQLQSSINQISLQNATRWSFYCYFFFMSESSNRYKLFSIACKREEYTMFFEHEKRDTQRRVKLHKIFATGIMIGSSFQPVCAGISLSRSPLMRTMMMPAAFTAFCVIKNYFLSFFVR